MKTSTKILTVLFTTCFIAEVLAVDAEAGFLFHATRSAFVPKIMKSGFKAREMNPKARFGKQIYFADKAETAMREKPRADALIPFRKSRSFNEHTLDTTKMSTEKLRSISRMKDMRGTVKNGVIGPKMGHKIGDYANLNRRVIKFNSARYKGNVNYAVPPKLYELHPRIARPVWK